MHPDEACIARLAGRQRGKRGSAYQMAIVQSVGFVQMLAAKVANAEQLVCADGQPREVRENMLPRDGPEMPVIVGTVEQE